MASATEALNGQEWLKLLRCPLTMQTLTVAPAELLERIERERVAGKLVDGRGHPVAERLEGAFLRSDGRAIYPMRQSLPVLLPEDLILLPAEALSVG